MYTCFLKLHEERHSSHPTGVILIQNELLEQEQLQLYSSLLQETKFLSNASFFSLMA